MAAIPDQYAEVSIELGLLGYVRSAFITFGAHAIGPQNTADQMAQSVRTVWQTIPGPNRWLDASVSARLFTVRLGTISGEALVGTATSSQLGGSAHNSPPPNCAVLVHKRTARGGRRGRGRLFIPWFVDETVVDETGTIQATWLGNLQTAMDAFLTGLSAAGLPMQILHGEGISQEGTPNEVTSLTVDPIIATQRRRLLR